MSTFGKGGTQGPESHSEDRSPVTSRQDYVTVFGSSPFQLTFPFRGYSNKLEEKQSGD